MNQVPSGISHDIPWLRCLELPGSGHFAQVACWLADLSHPQVAVPLIWPLLASDERARAERFLVENARRRYILARGALRILLADFTHQDPAALEFHYSPKGKPSLATATSRPFFSVSHSGDLALIALAADLPIGVDLEMFHDRSDLMDVARACFCPAEREAIERATAQHPMALFYRIWTRKEAVLKAAGQGITAGLCLPDVSGGLSDAQGTEQIVSLGPDRWWVQELDSTPGFFAAIAIQATF